MASTPLSWKLEISGIRVTPLILTPTRSSRTWEPGPKGFSSTLRAWNRLNWSSEAPTYMRFFQAAVDSFRGKFQRRTISGLFLCVERQDQSATSIVLAIR